ncbi:hypothetical protein BaRGS_00028880 [Batillaria attramentaria]|uniref:Uncharacterized protein n=1 Tax=Batillaria attramentaria TaxID=370345 RepID=A0ABD0JZ91_9CAEN
MYGVIKVDPEWDTSRWEFLFWFCLLFLKKLQAVRDCQVTSLASHGFFLPPPLLPFPLLRLTCAGESQSRTTASDRHSLSPLTNSWA